MNFELKDSNENKIVIHLGDFPLPELSKNPMNIDCVTISPRYDHGFGFSQLHRVVKDKDSEQIKKFCDLSNDKKQIQLLPKNVSDTWRVILTPTIKSNNEISRYESKDLMLKLFFQSQSHEVGCERLLITHFGHLQSYPDISIEGFLDGILDIRNQSFLNLKEIFVEIQGKYKKRLEQQVMNKFRELTH